MRLQCACWFAFRDGIEKLNWINAQRLEREPCALACQRIRASQTGEVLAQRLDEIIESCGLTLKHFENRY